MSDKRIVLTTVGSRQGGQALAQAHEGRMADMPLRQQARASAEGRP
mgnify:CR=1 FL=1